MKDRLISLLLRFAKGKVANSYVQLWNATTGQHIFTYSGNKAYVRAVKRSPDGAMIASGSISVMGGDTVKVRLAS